MRSYHIDHIGDLDGLTVRDGDVPVPGPDEVRIEIAANSLNARDIAILLGGYGGPSPKPGLVPLSDGVGTIVAAGERVRGFSVGDRVAGIFRQNWLGGRMPLRALDSDLGGSRDGMLTESIVLTDENIVKVPAHLSDQEAATLPCAAVTAWHALHAGEALLPGQSVLVLGSGGVSLFALQFAKHIGTHVIATTSTEEKAHALQALGADNVINYSATPEWDKEVMRITAGLGVDRVIEVGGAGTLARSMRAAAVTGRVVIIGVLAGGSQVDPSIILTRRLTLQAISTGSREMFEQMNAAITRWQLKPVIDTAFPFDEAKAAYRYAANGRHFGKVVISRP
ncbi:NAD(P)-dependent alcohol dehydrogenase [Paraburkholderia sp. USG1]|uniref:zinc-dependent alcohol dehydrogenase family protein n=1 Tax=Paraburkholderia sp. USG1 TaxID=2952268 RepID=UPI0028572A40|nr:NAD(P)-dependent alcohol dehydrogenase [Paraburkholderia sp. USG1]MDR8398707.1 NAD(P)-dependent alcohol dehydrogenase [Paraburkholderia sp. USG1]